MKNNILFVSFAILIVLACSIFISDGMTYIVSLLMGLSIIGGIRSNKKWVMKMTRWAKANPGKAQVYISIIQITLLLLGIITGYNLKELGYEFSNTSVYIFTAIMASGFAYVPFLPKRSIIAIPQQLEKNRFAFMSIALSSVVLMAIAGNRIGDLYPDSPVTHILEKIDQTIFPEDPTPFTEFDHTQIGQVTSIENKRYLIRSSAKPLLAAVDVRAKKEINKSSNSRNHSLKKSGKSKRELRIATRKARKEFRKLKRDRRKNYRRAGSGAACGLAILLVILLLAPLCAGICFIVGLFGNGSALAVIGGVGLTALSIWGMVEAINSCVNSNTKDD